MLKLLFILFTSFMTVGAINFCDENDISYVEKFFESNLETIRAEYKETFDEEWCVNSIDKVKKLYNLVDEHIGYLIDFDKGYIAYGLDFQMYKMETNGEPDFYRQKNRLYYNAGTFMEKNNDCFYLDNGTLFNPETNVGKGIVASDIYHQIETRLDYKGFKINASCTKIPRLREEYDSSKWGNYRAVSFEQGDTTDCGVIAIMDLLHTFKLSGSVDYTKGKKPNDMREDLRKLTNWQGNIAGEGMLPTDVLRGCTNYIGQDNISLKLANSYRDDVPEISLYCNLNIGNTSHYGMKVGSAQQDYWWVFKTYWDIIVSWHKNYFDLSGMPYMLSNSLECYYLVDQQYRQGAYHLLNGNELIF